MTLLSNHFYPFFFGRKLLCNLVDAVANYNNGKFWISGSKNCYKSGERPWYSVEDRCLLTDHLNKVDQWDYRKITIHSKKVVVGQSTARKKNNNNNNKNNRLLKTKSSIIDSKRFSRNESVSADYVFLLKTLHIQHLGDFFWYKRLFCLLLAISSLPPLLRFAIVRPHYSL